MPQSLTLLFFPGHETLLPSWGRADSQVGTRRFVARLSCSVFVFSHRVDYSMFLSSSDTPFLCSRRVCLPINDGCVCVRARLCCGLSNDSYSLLSLFSPTLQVCILFIAEVGTRRHVARILCINFVVIFFLALWYLLDLHHTATHRVGDPAQLRRGARLSDQVQVPLPLGRPRVFRLLLPLLL